MADNKTIKTEYELPSVLPFGWITSVAKTLGIHRNTVRNAIKEGESHPLYKTIMETAKQKFGVLVSKKH
jgi:DNA-binding transcriptional regulator YhcF (GntR family)